MALWAVGWMVLCLGVGLAVGQSPSDESAVAADSTDSPLALLRSGINDVLTGKVDEGIAEIEQAHQHAPDDAKAQAAQQAATEYHTAAAAAETQRKTEYATTVLRIERAMMSQDALSELGDKHKALRTKIREMSTAYSKSGSSDAFAEATEKNLPTLQENGRTRLAESRKALAEAAAIVAELPESTYTKTFAQLSQTADKALANLEEAWKNATFETPKEQKDSAVALMEAEEPLFDTLADLETVVAEQPWKIALIQARIAKQIAAPSDNMRDQDWYKDLLIKVGARGQAAMEQASKPWKTDPAAADTKCDGCNTIVVKEAAVKDVPDFVKALLAHRDDRNTIIAKELSPAVTKVLYQLRETRDTIVAKGEPLLTKDGSAVCCPACASKLDGIKWYDAMTAFAGLEDLEHDNTTYQERGKEVRSHVRVLRLYGTTTVTQRFQLEDGRPVDGSQVDLNPGLGVLRVVGWNPSAPPSTTTQPALSGDDEEDDPTLGWMDLTRDIDLEMVRKAVTKIKDDYVTKPDFRALTLGALRSIKILAETPQSANSFPNLGDYVLREKFLTDLDRLTVNIREKDNVDYLDLQLNLNKVWNASESSVKIPVSVLAMEFADGFFSELDPFSNMIWPCDLNDFKKSTQGKFCGVGIQITKDEGEPLKVVTPLRGSPAIEVGIKTGDLILTVDGKSTREISTEKLITMIMGPPKTKVTFEIERRGLLEPLTIEVERREISIQTVKGWKIKADGNYDFMIDPANKIAYVRLTQFSEDTYEDLRVVLDQLKADGVTSLIMDLRFNPGGYLRSAVEIVDEFIQKGRIVSTAGRQPNPQVIEGRGNGRFLEGDLVVLVNENSASAAEIVSGALKDYHRATIIGDRSYGKGSVQSVVEVSKDKAYLKLTTAYYYLPSGRLLHRKTGSAEWGVDPDICVSMTPKQLRRWLDIRRKTDLLVENAGEELDNDLQNQYKTDLPLNLAVMVLKLKQIQKTK